MSVILNASTSSGFAQTADTSGQIELQSNGTTELTVTSTGVSIADTLSFNSGFGSAAPAYGCRAWVNFNGQGTPAINGSGNVSSITDNGTGDYTLNFTTALTDANYAVVGTASDNNSGDRGLILINQASAPTTSAVRLATIQSNTTSKTDFQINGVAIFR